MKTLAATVPTEHRPQALYLSIYGNDVFGGGDDTSYHDVITAAGLRDATIGRFQGYPQLSTEQILNLDPDLVVTKQGMGQVLCSRSGLATLRACHAADGIVELDGNLLDDAGPGMLDAAETLYALIHRAR
jgi:ABC-type hemin transport system substrate-binding protein